MYGFLVATALRAGVMDFRTHDAMKHSILSMLLRQYTISYSCSHYYSLCLLSVCVCLIGSDSWLINNSEILARESNPEIDFTPNFKLLSYKSRKLL